MDHWKTFDTPNRRLLLAKLTAYGRQLAALKIMQKCLTSCYQKTKINNIYSSQSEIITGFPQGSILRPRFSNIFFKLFILICKRKVFKWLPGNNTLYATGNTVDKS